MQFLGFPKKIKKILDLSLLNKSVKMAINRSPEYWYYSSKCLLPILGIISSRMEGVHFIWNSLSEKVIYNKTLNKLKEDQWRKISKSKSTFSPFLMLPRHYHYVNTVWTNNVECHRRNISAKFSCPHVFQPINIAWTIFVEKKMTLKVSAFSH